MLGLAIANLNIFIIINKKPPSLQFITTTLGGGVHMIFDVLPEKELVWSTILNHLININV